MWLVQTRNYLVLFNKFKCHEASCYYIEQCSFRRIKIIQKASVNKANDTNIIEKIKQPKVDLVHRSDHA